MKQLIQNIQEQAGKSPEFSHPFYMKVKEMADSNAWDEIVKEKIPLKLLRVTPHAQDGFILTHFPSSVKEAEMLEEYKGGISAFVHLSLPDEILLDIENNKLVCQDCGRHYYIEQIEDPDNGIRIEPFFPADGVCVDCGSTDIKASGDPRNFEESLEQYKGSKEDLLGFYDHLGLLVDFELNQGFEDYDRLKKKIQYTIKH